MVTPTPIKSVPTPDQRVKIRSYLDKHFDDGQGCYLDGMSDLKIAEAVGLPRVAIETIRESVLRADQGRP